MSAPYNNIDTKVEAALKEVITDAVTAGTLSLTDAGDVRTGIDVNLSEENNIICYVDAAEELFPRSGVWSVNCIVTVNTNFDGNNALTNHKSNVAKIRDLFMDSALDVTLNATDEDIIVSGVNSFSINNSTDSRMATGDLTFTLVVSAN